MLYQCFGRANNQWIYQNLLGLHDRYLVTFSGVILSVTFSEAIPDICNQVVAQHAPFVTHHSLLFTQCAQYSITIVSPNLQQLIQGYYLRKMAPQLNFLGIISTKTNLNALLSLLSRNCLCFRFFASLNLVCHHLFGTHHKDNLF